MKVYVVIGCNIYDDEEFVARVFSTEEKAQYYCNFEAKVDLGKDCSARYECLEVE